MNHVTHPFSSADISIFSPENDKFSYTRNADIDFFSVLVDRLSRLLSGDSSYIVVILYSLLSNLTANG